MACVVIFKIFLGTQSNVYDTFVSNLHFKVLCFMELSIRIMFYYEIAAKLNSLINHSFVFICTKINTAKAKTGTPKDMQSIFKAPSFLNYLPSYHNIGIQSFIAIKHKKTTPCN